MDGNGGSVQGDQDHLDGGGDEERARNDDDEEPEPNLGIGNRNCRASIRIDSVLLRFSGEEVRHTQLAYWLRERFS